MEFLKYKYFQANDLSCGKFHNSVYYTIMNIGNVKIEGHAVLAPLAGISDSSFRHMCRSMGAALTYTEMASSEGLIRGNTKTLRYVLFHEHEHPIGIQISGENAEVVAGAAKSLAAYNPDIIDFNVGCPVRKVVRKGAGAALLRDLDKLGNIVSALVKAVSLPVTVKFRSGWTENEIVAKDAAIIFEECGAAAITLHPRSRKTDYSFSANWDLIKEVKKTVGIPVIGNGDVFTPQDAKRLLDETGCDMVMVARGSLGRPWIFNQIRTYLDTGELIPPPSYKERIAICLKHLALSMKAKGTYLGVVGMRKHIGWYTHGMPGSARFRADVMLMKDYDEVRNRFHKYLEDLEMADTLSLLNDPLCADPNYIN